MDRTESYLSILDAMVKIQYNVALILEAKAVHAEKSRNWICNHLSTAAYEDNAAHVKESQNIHAQLLSVIEGVTKMEVAFAKHMGVLLGKGEEASSGGAGGGFGDLFGVGSGMEK
ncbi:restriction endonuclease subunit S [Paenibacillus aceris]|uniref:Restriction endonuclease subunit S n=1 Tax=Paenibacillus aceris TaxID=869555 RepID=A0ABS4I7S6_9BACL|nr:restriction endonuclease subunit S [Paenibacillus aceris]MBP1966979.1 hypothetical protein [Paenibacillus aceris]NHW39343.1 restriction endonuclease subunit S [Paenibacillus aceris]